jgi:hypothetical protein
MKKSLRESDDMTENDYEYASEIMLLQLSEGGRCTAACIRRGVVERTALEDEYIAVTRGRGNGNGVESKLLEEIRCQYSGFCANCWVHILGSPTNRNVLYNRTCPP